MGWIFSEFLILEQCSKTCPTWLPQGPGSNPSKASFSIPPLSHHTCNLIWEHGCQIGDFPKNFYKKWAAQQAKEDPPPAPNAEEEKAKYKALRALVQSDEPTNDAHIIALRKVRDQVKAQKAPSPPRSPDPVERELRQAGDQFKVPRGSTGIKITLSAWASSWTRETNWKEDAKRNALGFKNCGIKLEEWSRFLGGGKIVPGSINSYVQGAEYFLQCFDIELDDPLMNLADINHLDLVRKFMCWLMHWHFAIWILHVGIVHARFEMLYVCVFFCVWHLRFDIWALTFQGEWALQLSFELL